LRRWRQSGSADKGKPVARRGRKARNPERIRQNARRIVRPPKLTATMDTAMQRTLVLSLVLLLAIVRSPVVAQTCMGMASFSAVPVQVAASGTFSDLSNSLGGSVGYGMPSGVFGTVGVSTTSYDGVDGSTTVIAGRAGYQLVMSQSRPIQICPNVGIGIGMGPSDGPGGAERSSRSLTAGLSVGTELGASPRMTVVPSVGLSYAHEVEKAEDAAGAILFEISDGYALAQLGVGIILNRHLSIRPGVDFPVGLEGSNPMFGLTVGYNFGK
jgi:hypothetical protein